MVNYSIKWLLCTEHFSLNQSLIDKLRGVFVESVSEQFDISNKNILNVCHSHCSVQRVSVYCAVPGVVGGVENFPACTGATVTVMLPVPFFCHFSQHKEQIWWDIDCFMIMVLKTKYCWSFMRGNSVIFSFLWKTHAFPVASTQRSAPCTSRAKYSHVVSALPNVCDEACFFYMNVNVVFEGALLESAWCKCCVTQPLHWSSSQKGLRLCEMQTEI